MKSSLYDNLLNKDDTKHRHGYQIAYKKSVAFFYDGKSKNVCGRTITNLILMILYIMGLSIVMMLFTTGMFFIFTEFIINEDQPFQGGVDSILKNTPALSFRPLVDFKTALIRYRDSDPSTYMTYIQSLRAYIDLYEDKNTISEEAYANCINGKKTPNDPNKPCKFDLKQLYMCNKQYNFGYDRGTPCVMLKMNRIYGWKPETQNATLTKDILVECYGQNQEDIENFSGVRYYPNTTIDGKTYGYLSHLYYPYLVQYGYRQPLVGVLFKTPRRNVILMIQCKIVNLITPTDPITFEILID